MERNLNISMRYLQAIKINVGTKKKVKNGRVHNIKYIQTMGERGGLLEDAKSLCTVIKKIELKEFIGHDDVYMPCTSL